MFRSKAALIVLSFSLSVALPAFAQRGSQSQCNSQVDIQVHVTYSDGQPAPRLLKVSLEDSSGAPGSQVFTNDLGEANFHVAGCNSYRVRVSGMGIEETVSDTVLISQDDRSMPLYVVVNRPANSDSSANSKKGNGAITSASELRIPPAARKSFDRGLEAFKEKDYKKAVALFQKATITYPEYDAAYDNLGVALMNLGRTAEARTAFARAVKLNDKNADADRNYSRLLISDEKFIAAKELLQKALTVEPQAPSSLILLAITQLRTGDYDGALHSALEAHHISQEGYAVAHYVAGRAFENKHEMKNATTEYQMYLRESPNGPEAGQVRAGLARVGAAPPLAPQ